jgi:outer membrane receptor protein involved in Fe transport
MMLGLVWIAAAGTAAAQPQDSAGKRSSQDIIVTGERAKRALRDTPSSVEIVGERQLEAQPADRLDQVLASVPNVQLGHGSEGPAIRGLDTTGALQALPAFLGGNRPRTTVVVDGRAETYSEFVFGAEPVWDVERIEVFRTPQTTTQGQNSIAGAIFVYTNDPSFEPEYRGRVIVGDLKTREAAAVVSGPVDRDVAFRVAGDLRYSRTTSKIADRAVGADPNHDAYGVLRAKLLATPAALPGTQISLTYTHNQSQAPQVVGLTRPFHRRRDESGFYGTFRINVDAVTAAVRHDSGTLSASLLVTSGTSKVLRLAFPGLGQARNDGSDWSGEAVVNWSPPGPMKFVGGISRQHVELRQIIDLSALSGLGRFRDWQDGTGVFGEASLQITDRLTLSSGLRYQRDRQKRVGALDSLAGAPIALDYDRTSDAWLPKASIAFDVSPALRVGALVQQAYNPGGTTLRFDTGRPDNFDPEKLWDYELFGRATLAGGRLGATANLFYYDIRNAQRARDIRIRAPAGFVVGFADLFNVPRARSYGAEAQFGWSVTPRLTARLGIGLLSTQVVRSIATDTELDGKEFGRSPHFTGSASIDWRPARRLRLSALLRYHSRYFSDDANAPESRVGSAALADVRAQYDFRRISLFAYARNLFNNFAIVEAGIGTTTAEDPREIGVGIDTRF